MALQMKTIKEKMETISNIRKVTKAMEMISVSKMKKIVSKRNEALHFSEEARNILINLHLYHKTDHLFFQKGKEGGAILLIIIASNRGLCGAYNSNIDRKVQDFLDSHQEREIRVIGVGKEVQKIVARHDLPLLALFEEYDEIYEAEEAHSLYRLVLKEFQSGEYEEVKIIYTEFINSLSFRPQIKSFIPFDLSEYKIDSLEKDEREYIFEPNKKRVLDMVIQQLLLTVLYQYLLESLASEHSSRVMAMKNASESAGEMLENLIISFNRARQAAITQEIAEIVGALSAMSS